MHALARAAILLFALWHVAAPAGEAEPKRILVVSSYHPGYLWSQDTAAGVGDALVEVGWLDGAGQVETLNRTDEVLSARAHIRKLWMDSKRRNSPRELAAAVDRVMQVVESFGPDLVLVGDDNAANYVGGNLFDTRIPVVFWGVNGNPRKYGLIDSMARPGHNVTGVYQAGYLEEGLRRLRRLLPEVKRVAVLSDASPTGRAKVKQIERAARRDELGAVLVGTVVTDSFRDWKRGALELQGSADAFFVLNHNTLKDDEGRPVPQLEAGAWYLRNVRRPDISHERQFVIEGVLCAVDDSGYRQGYEAVRIAARILDGGEDPAGIPVRAPPPGEFVVNVARADMLGLSARVAGSPLVEARIDRMLALSGP